MRNGWSIRHWIHIVPTTISHWVVTGGYCEQNRTKADKMSVRHGHAVRARWPLRTDIYDVIARFYSDQFVWHTLPCSAISQTTGRNIYDIDVVRDKKGASKGGAQYQHLLYGTAGFILRQHRGLAIASRDVEQMSATEWQVGSQTKRETLYTEIQERRQVEKNDSVRSAGGRPMATNDWLNPESMRASIHRLSRLRIERGGRVCRAARLAPQPPAGVVCRVSCYAGVLVSYILLRGFILTSNLPPAMRDVVCEIISHATDIPDPTPAELKRFVQRLKNW
ncbi:Hypothetical predicted protein [Olea europaea subsp. europaea]|uniref:Uncharacterized protein n=1 Tax=Olea europaea subsp. europaea TaxID=158383 RepID=A0A8S0RD21_OLEEU|nr:Hypothetical predicted protein [Olea europaea subsp. europaea]